MLVNSIKTKKNESSLAGSSKQIERIYIGARFRRKKRVWFNLKIAKQRIFWLCFLLCRNLVWKPPNHQVMWAQQTSKTKESFELGRIISIYLKEIIFFLIKLSSSECYKLSAWAFKEKLRHGKIVCSRKVSFSKKTKIKRRLARKREHNCHILECLI